MRVLVVGEGPHEERALPVLVRRLQPAVSETLFDYVRNGRRVHGKGAGLFFKGRLPNARPSTRSLPGARKALPPSRSACARFE
jgi:hypothetical protein